MRVPGFLCGGFVLLMSGFLSTPGRAQSFTFTTEDTLLTAPLGNEVVFNTTLTNISPEAITLVLVRELNDLPQGWESSMCFDACFPSSTDSIFTTSEYGSAPLQPSESRLFSLHVYPITNYGTGRMSIVVRNSRDGEDRQMQTFTALSTTSRVREERHLPQGYSLLQNFPNPFNPSTEFLFDLPESGAVSLSIVDMLGRNIAEVAHGYYEAGHHSVTWNALAASGHASGVYLARIIVSDASGQMAYISTNKVVIMK